MSAPVDVLAVLDQTPIPYPWDLQPTLLFMAGHTHRKGYAVCIQYGDGIPVRFTENLGRTTAVVDRFNRMQWRRWDRRIATALAAMGAPDERP